MDERRFASGSEHRATLAAKRPGVIPSRQIASFLYDLPNRQIELANHNLANCPSANRYPPIIFTIFNLFVFNLANSNIPNRIISIWHKLSLSRVL